tara:strand:- start:3545 stop:4021 length:477 start_codon:yes stop_codon:yes gene_type:complete
MANLIDLPYAPERSSYSYSKSDGIVTITLDGGLSKSRKDVIGNASIVSCEWVLNTTQFEEFMLFYNIIAQKGVRPFKAALILDKPSAETFDARFVPDTLVSSAPNELQNYVSASLEVVPVELTDQQYADFIKAQYPNSYVTMFNDLAAIIGFNYNTLV